MNPEACIPLFHGTQGTLKRRGDKSLVLRAAELTIRAAQTFPPLSVDARKAEAEALICGRSWVYQRTNRLDEADTFAKKVSKSANI